MTCQSQDSLITACKGSRKLLLISPERHDKLKSCLEFANGLYSKNIASFLSLYQNRRKCQQQKVASACLEILTSIHKQFGKKGEFREIIEIKCIFKVMSKYSLSKEIQKPNIFYLRIFFKPFHRILNNFSSV